MAPSQSLKNNVAVIGAGVSGLLTARELQRQGVKVVVFEKSSQIGGTWVYTPEVENDPLGLDPNRNVVHSSLYASLRTNSFTCVTGFSDYPFKVEKNGQEILFPGHDEVLKFLNNFVRDFDLLQLVRFNTNILRVEQANPEDKQWVVESRTSENSSLIELFDAVVICTGHNTQPRLSKLKGIENWTGKQIHSHNYRVPEPFRDQVVLLNGFGPSGFDIAVEVAKVAKEVHVTNKHTTEAHKIEILDNLWMHSPVDYCSENGKIVYKDGSSNYVDVIIHCTGYNYNFPFLKTNGIVSIDDNRVGPLYKHVFPPQLAPGLSFVGIPRMAINFPVIELQAKWVAQVISGKLILPSKEEMLADVEQHYQLMDQNGVPKHHTHNIHYVVGEYLNWLAAQVGEPPFDKKLIDLYYAIGKAIADSWIEFRERLENSLSDYID